MEAVDAIFEALAELGSKESTPPPVSMLGHEAQPRVFCDFTSYEIREAEAFLKRCGLI